MGAFPATCPCRVSGPRLYASLAVEPWAMGAQEFICGSLALSSRSSYFTKVREFQIFCGDLGLVPSWPIPWNIFFSLCCICMVGECHQGPLRYTCQHYVLWQGFLGFLIPPIISGPLGCLQGSIGSGLWLQTREGPSL